MGVGLDGHRALDVEVDDTKHDGQHENGAPLRALREVEGDEERRETEDIESDGHRVMRETSVG